MCVVTCPACLGKSYNINVKSPLDYEYFIRRRIHDINILKCNDCGSYFQFPPPSIEELSTFYQSDYQNYVSTNISFLKFIAKIYNRLTALHFTSTYKTSAYILDFGCGQGEFLRCLHSSGYSNIYGFDFDIYNEAKTDGIKFIWDFEQLCSLGVKFDVIRLNHVIEHIPNLDLIIPQLLSLLNENGCIIGQTPNSKHYTSKIWGRFWGNYHYPYHLTIFSVVGLKIACNRWNAFLTTNSAFLTNGWALSCENLLKTMFRSNTRGRTFFYPLLMVFSFIPALIDHLFSPQASANFNFKIIARTSFETTNQVHAKNNRHLPSQYLKIYQQVYKDYASSKGPLRTLTHFIESWYHKKVGQVLVKDNQRILEIGCGSLNHVKYENNFSSYDVVEPQYYLLENSSPIDQAFIQNKFQDLHSLPTTNKYDKIISIACLEHVLNLEEHLYKVKFHLSPDGKFVAAIPAEGEFMWWLCWRISTGVAFWLKYRLDYGVIMRYEHINSAEKISCLLRSSFQNVEQLSFPFRLKHFRIYLFFKCSNPIFDSHE